MLRPTRQAQVPLRLATGMILKKSVVIDSAFF
jgi:hypothetical protein